MFAPLSQPPNPSFYRTHLQESIIKANTRQARFESGSSLAAMDIMEYLNSMGISAQNIDLGELGGEGRGGVEDLRRGCTTQ